MNGDLRSKNFSRTVMEVLLISGMIAIAATSPRFGENLARAIYKEVRYRKIMKEKKERYKKYANTFYYMKQKGYLNASYKGRQLYISLTPEGRKLAGKYQIDDLKIKKSKKWDGKWHILIFDIENRHKSKREALRGKLKEWECYQLQKSVWASPYDFRKEIGIMREFLGLSKKEIVLITATHIDDEQELKRRFGL